MCAKIGSKPLPCAEFDDYMKKPENKNKDLLMASSEWSSRHTSDGPGKFRTMISCSFCPLCNSQPTKKIDSTRVMGAIEDNTSNIVGKFELFDLNSAMIAHWNKLTYVQTDIESATEAETVDNESEDEDTAEHNNGPKDKRVDSPVPA
jgi:hypothetical protein